MRRGVPWPETDDGKPEPGPTRGSSSRRAILLSLLALAGLVAFHVAQMSSWVRREGRPPAWDQATHLQISLECKRALEAGDWRRILSFKPKPGMPPFPPLYHLSILYAHKYPDPALAALWANCFYMALLCLSLWGLGRHFGGEWAGLAAAVLFSCAPQTQWLYYNQLTDLAVTAWVSAAYWALLSSSGFWRRGPSLLFGLAFAASMLTKWSAFSYFLPAGWMAARALGDSNRRWKMLSACAVAAALCAPWYLSQWAVLLPRLMDASSDRAVAVWKGTAALTYLLQMIAGLETPLWLLGILSVCLPITKRHQEDAAILVLWALGSLAFWTVVPNRQLRYLLPGLPPLAVLASATWSRRLLPGLVVYQLAVAANYTIGRIPHMGPTLFLPTSFFTCELPRKEDWKIAEILREAQRLHEPDLPLGNLTVVANHPRFNGPTFNWAADSLGLKTVYIRGVNRRLCEFSEFVVVKTGSLGPPEVVNQLPEVQRFMLEGKNWFSMAFREVRRWDLPDKTQAILFMRRRLTAPPLREQKAYFDYYEERGFVAENISIDLGRWDFRRGVYPRVRVLASQINIRGMEISDVLLDMEDLALVPVQQPGKGSSQDPLLDFRFLRMKRLRLVSAAVSEDQAAAFLKNRVRVIDFVRVRLRQTISAVAVIRRIPVEAEVAAVLAPDRKSLTLKLKDASILGLRIPPAFFGVASSYGVDFHPNPELPFEVDIPGLKIAGGRLEIAR